ncbi:hypothetical protein LOTGIDRAFT_172621 [Lottia gigantea]|uniref:Heme oxygenase n=1 Tax=Lottia gigantea TaxID=225164 RepID=V4AVZ7_LOTGI|nr:hypothetical protein LOTGIDRAFT_172621 [Lottia gigantea]ESP01588.1 hypothetical protein LOTGIDRAFT_172621 [Lottia gigantea]
MDKTKKLATIDVSRNRLYIKDRTTPIEQAILFATFDLHRDIELTPFAQTMVTGTISRSNYAYYLSQLYFIYKTLEEANDRCKENPVFKTLYYPDEMNRQDALAGDLAFFYGDDWKHKIKPTPTTQIYMDRINFISTTKPELLVAHNFIRYFGEFSGGQVLKHKIKKGLQLEDLRGTKVYEFEKIENLKHFKQFYLDQMNAIELTSTQYYELIEESRHAFQLNIDNFLELEDILASLNSGYLTKLRKSMSAYSDVTLKATTVILAGALVANFVRSRA